MGDDSGEIDAIKILTDTITGRRVFDDQGSRWTYEQENL